MFLPSSFGVASRPTPVQRHTRKVSFNVLGQSAENASMLPSIVQGKTTSSDIPTVIFTQFGSEPCELEMKDVQIS